jgi:hypothetical protein
MLFGNFAHKFQIDIAHRFKLGAAHVIAQSAGLFATARAAQ